MERAEKAVEFKHQGYNCCQAVLAAFADVVDLPEETLKRIGAPFGSGMGGMDGSCGALCGAEMVLGLKDYEGKPMHAKAKALHEDFRAKSGATICRELKGIDTGKVLCSCDDCVRHGVQAVMDIR
ncbi:MAG: C_GCAxxG_C_C family protein [Selenomonadaceae bacterium]|nr:C_GCAxxG_C_C family protein [Selenomonadaceae bacterium]